MLRCRKRLSRHLTLPLWREEDLAPHIFPKWVNKLRQWGGVAAVGVPIYIIALVWYGASPWTMNVGYAPTQPVPYSHALHAGLLGIDCRYCHTSVEKADFAAIPPTQTCMNCHTAILPNSAKLLEVRKSYASGMPIEWVKVHDLPDFVYFNHSAHVMRGVSCMACHGRVDKMEVVTQVKPLSMGWCLECHRNPEKYLRPLDKVTQLDWIPDEDQIALGKRLKEQYNINPSTDCNTCHR